MPKVFIIQNGEERFRRQVRRSKGTLYIRYKGKLWGIEKIGEEPIYKSKYFEKVTRPVYKLLEQIILKEND